MQVDITNYGGIVVSLRVPDRLGRFSDVVLGYETLDGYLSNRPYFGAIIGRYANRIAGACFRLHQMEYRLARNDGANHLHGGIRGFDKVAWDARASVTDGQAALRLHYLSADGEEGYPGNLDVEVTYTLTNDDALRIDYFGRCDSDTVLNLSNHTYFNLRDAGRSDILGHELTIHAGSFTPINDQLIPTGEVRSVAGTPFDFTGLTAVGARIGQQDEQLIFGRGYDHNFVLNGEPGTLTFAAEVHEPTSGRVMQVHTTQPAMQFYSGNFLDGTIVGKDGFVYGGRHGLCLETQHFPDSPNQPQFPTTVLKKEEDYRAATTYRFRVK